MHELQARALLIMVVDNNIAGLIAELKRRNYTLPFNITRDTLISFMMSIYNSNQNEFLNIIRSVQYNPNAGNYTTSVSFVNSINKLIK